MKNEKRIKELEDEIYNLKQDDCQELKSLILPFIVKNCKLKFNRYSSFNVISNKLDELIKLVSSASDGDGFYHFGCQIEENVSVRFNDGSTTVDFQFSGKVDDSLKKSILKCKELGLKVDFTEAKQAINLLIDKDQKELIQIKEWEKLLSNE